jgi:hypothetical protein
MTVTVTKTKPGAGKKIKLSAPVVPGSTLTERALAKAVNAAAKVRFGPALATQQTAVNQAKQAAQDVGGRGGFYDQYLAQVRQHAANVNNIVAATNASIGQLPGAVTGLAAADTGSLQGAMDVGAAARGMGPAGNLGPMASGAAATSQGMAANLAAQQQALGGASRTFADTQAHVVAPAQKLTAQTQGAARVETARAARRETKSEVGAYKAQTGAAMRSDEAKNVLAQETLTGNLASKAATARTSAGNLKERHRHDAALEHQAASSAAAAQQKAIQQAATAANKRVQSGPFAGLTQTEVNGLSTKQAQHYVDRYHSSSGSGKGGKGAKAPTLTLTQQGSGLQQLPTILSYAQKRHGQKQTYAKAEQAINANNAKIKNPALTRAALDTAYFGHLWHTTAKMLVAAGYDPNQVAQTMRTKSYADWLRTPAGRTYANSQAYARGRSPQPMGHA